MSYTKVTLIFDDDDVAKAAVSLVANTSACIHHEIESITDQTALSLAKTMQKTIGKRWCMCPSLSGVARDGFSTCSICNGQDAYGKSQLRPFEFKKILDRDKPTANNVLKAKDIIAGRKEKAT